MTVIEGPWVLVPLRTQEPCGCGSSTVAEWTGMTIIDGPGILVPSGLKNLVVVVDEQWLAEQLAKMTMEERIALGFNFSELVLDCRYAGSECTSQ